MLPHCHTSSFESLLSVAYPAPAEQVCQRHWIARRSQRQPAQPRSDRVSGDRRCHRLHALGTVLEPREQTQAQTLLQRAEDVQALQQIPPLSSIPASHVLALVQRAERVALQPGDLVAEAGQPASDLLILCEGKISAEKTGPHGSTAGEIIGLREVLLEANFTRSIRAETNVVLWRISKANLYAVVAQYPDLGLELYSAATRQLTALAEDLQDDIHQREALRAYTVTSPRVGIIGSSRYAKRLRTQVTKAALDASRPHVLVFGEPGLEKDTIASLIHFGSGARREAMVRLDCSRPEGGLPEMFGRGRKKGLLHWLQSGTLLLTNFHQAPPHAQERLVALLEDGTYRQMDGLPATGMGQAADASEGEGQLHQSSARIILTSQQAYTFPASCKVQEIKVPPLRVRAMDVAELQRYFLRQAAKRRGVPNLTLTPAAVRQLQSYNYPNNIQELASMVERAATQASDFGPEISDSVFWFATKVQDRLRFNLFKGLPELKQLLRSDWWPEKINHNFTVWIYPAYVALLLWGPQDPSRNFGISLFWNYWWPVIFLIYPFLGRVWCSVCPFMIYGEVTQRWRLAQGAVMRTWPRQLSQRWGPWFLFSLFAAILVWEEVWDLPHSPYLSAWLLLIITAGAMVCSWTFERRLWCRYLCPIGGMNGLFAKLAVTELRAKQGVCHSNCATYHCYKGGPAEPPEGLATNGCPLHSHPAQLTDNADCVLCMDCLKACPHGSVEFRLRPPGMDLWTSHTPSAAELALQFMLLGAIYVHHLPVVTSQLGLDPALLDATLPHCIASLSILTLPGLLALGAHGVTHYLTRITHHLSLHQQRMPQRVRQESGSETGASNESGNARGDSRSAPAEGDLQGEFIAAMRVRLVRVGAASLQAGSEMALETRDAAGLQLKDLSTQLLKSLRRAGSNLRLSQMAALQSATANAPRPSQSKPMKASSDDSSSSRAAGDLKLAELSSRQKLPTAAVQAAVGRSQPPQKFLQLAYGYLPLVWAGTLTHYLPAFLLQAGRILPVTARTIYADKWAPMQPESLPEFAADPAVVTFLQAACLLFGTGASLALLRKLGGRPWPSIAPHCIMTLAFAAELWRLTL